MKAKYLIIVSLVLAILTIGAVSASDDIADNLTANDDSGDKIATINDDEAIQDSAEDGDVLEDVKASDFDVKIVTNEINLDDKDKDDKTIFSFYCPNGTEGGSVFAKYQEDEWEHETDHFNIESGDIKTYNNITFEDFDIDSIGSYNYKVYYSYYDDVYGNVEMGIGSGTLNVTKTLNPEEDFGYSEKTAYNAYDDDFVFKLWNIPCDGTLIIYVNGTQKYSKYLYDDFDEEIIDVPNLDITEYGTYKILAKFRPIVGDEVNITSFVLTYYYDNYDPDYDENGPEVYDYVDLSDPTDTLGAVRDYSYIVGTVKVFINNKEVYTKTFTAADKQYELSFNVADLKLASYARGKYTVKITYQKPGEALQSDEKLVNFTVRPKISWSYEMMVGENAGLLISGPKGISGSATLYNAVEDEYGYKKGSVFATVPIVDGSARISFAKLAEGTHRFYLDYTYGDEKYVSGIDDWNTVEVYKKDARFSSSISATTILVGQNPVVTLTGPASSNDEVYIKVDGETVKQISRFSGSLKETVLGLTAGTHYVTVMISGDSYYSNTFEVKVNTPAPAKKDTIKLTLKKVKVKKSAKKLVLQATLKINGKAVKGKVIKFKFNKKSYKAKTNKKGVAKVTVKKAVLKKLKVGKKVKIQATYGKVTKKYTVKVKK